ncbi:cleavage polyadenylation factor subunit fip1 [Coemansia sp. RSA 2711]|nr:cleavage polyadenylation factor subunit fip1 [Coemansia sp. RSA 2711]
MSNADDDDAFLYGDVEPPSETTEKSNAPELQTARDERHEGDNEPEAQPVSAQTDDSKYEASDSDSSSDEEDLEVILEPGKSGAAGMPVVGDGLADANTDGANEIDGQERKGKGATDVQGMLENNADHMDILSVPLLNGLDMFTIDIDMLEEKPWRQPGADITDYFNFGFSEEAWKLYCVKQQDLRAKFSMHKMLPHMMMMANPAMFPGMMGGGNNMYPPGMVRPGPTQGAPSASEHGSKGDDGDGSRDQGDDAKKHMTPQQLQYQQQLRMGMPPGFFPPGMRGMPMNQQQMNMQMANLPPQVQMQMQMGGRPPMSQNAPGHQRSGPNTNYMGRGPPHIQKQHSQGHERRDSDRGSESGRSSRRHASRERSGSRRPHRDGEGERSHSRAGGDRDRARDRARGRDVSRAERDKSTDPRRSSDRRRERSERSRERSSRGADRSDRSSAHKRRRSVSKDQEPKSTSRRRH